MRLPRKGMSGVSCLPYSGRRIAVSGLMFVRVVLPGTAVLVATHEGAADVSPGGTSLAWRKLTKDKGDKRKNAKRKEEKDEKKEEGGKERTERKGEIIDGDHDLPCLRLLASRDSLGSFPSFFRANTWTLHRPVVELKRLLGIYMEDGLGGTDRFFNR